MRLILMYDLDMSTPQLIKEYNRFHKWIISRGYVMMQYSVYMRTINAPSKKVYEVKAIRKQIPKNGNIRLITITNRQYNNMEFLRGSKSINETINNESRRIKIEYENTNI